LFTRHGEQLGCFENAWHHWRFVCLLIYLNLSVTEQPAVMLEQTSKNRSTVLLKYVYLLAEKRYKYRQSLSLIANESPKTGFLNYFLHFQVFTEHLEHPEYLPLEASSPCSSATYINILTPYHAAYNHGRLTTE